MSIFKSYFSKNNTIISESVTNTAKNPVTEIFYGGFYSRYLLQIDLTDLKSRIDSGFINRDSIEKHTLKLKNTINLTDSSFFGEGSTVSTKRATSFKLVIFKLDEVWDEGVGYDYSDTSDMYPLQNSFVENPSNWFYSKGLALWTEEGARIDSNIIGSQEFDNGNEDLEIDITDYINSVLDGNEEHYGLGISFDIPYEQIDSVKTYQAVSFFSKYTQTFFEPYMETKFDDHFIDNRNDFYENVDRCLILYVNQANEPTNLDFEPLVDISDNGSVILSDLQSEHVSKGIYRVCFKVDSKTCPAPKILNDTWKEVTIDGYSIGDVNQEFTLRSNTEFFNIGTDEQNPQEYNYSFTGLKRDEKIVRGDVRKVYVDVRVPFMYEGKVQIDGLKYRLYVKEGKTNIDVIEWTDINRAYNSNYFLLDTSMLIPNKEYYLDLQLETNREINTYRKEISFYVVNRK